MFANAYVVGCLGSSRDVLGANRQRSTRVG